MKKILVRMGFIAAMAAASTTGFAHATADAHDAPQATKQYCC